MAYEDGWEKTYDFGVIPYKPEGSLILRTFVRVDEYTDVNEDPSVNFAGTCENAGGEDNFRLEMWLIDPRTDTPLDGQTFEFAMGVGGSFHFNERLLLPPTYDHTVFRVKVLGYVWVD